MAVEHRTLQYLPKTGRERHDLLRRHREPLDLVFLCFALFALL